MDLLGPIHDFLLVFLGSGLILRGLGVVLLTNSIYSAFSLGLVFVYISLFYIPSNSHFVAAVQLLIYVGAINVLIIFAEMKLHIYVVKILILGAALRNFGDVFVDPPQLGAFSIFFIHFFFFFINPRIAGSERRELLMKELSLGG